MSSGGKFQQFGHCPVPQEGPVLPPPSPLKFLLLPRHIYFTFSLHLSSLRSCHSDQCNAFSKNGAFSQWALAFKLSSIFPPKVGPELSSAPLCDRPSLSPDLEGLLIGLTRYASAASWRHSIAADWNRRSVLKSWPVSLTNLWKGSFRMSSAEVFWKWRMSCRATVPALYLWGFTCLPCILASCIFLFCSSVQSNTR